MDIILNVLFIFEGIAGLAWLIMQKYIEQKTKKEQFEVAPSILDYVALSFRRQPSERFIVIAA